MTYVSSGESWRYRKGTSEASSPVDAWRLPAQQVARFGVVVPGADPVLRFKGDSDAHIVRGLVAIMLAACSGKKASQIVGLDESALFSRLGLIEHLTPQRANGLRSMVARIKAEASAASGG